MDWNLNDIIDSSRFDELTDDFILMLKKLDANIGKFLLSPEKHEFKKIVYSIENCQDQLNRIYGYPALAVEKNNNDNQNIYLKNKAKNLITKFDDTTRKFMHFIKGLKLDGVKTLNDKDAQAYFDDLGKLKYRYEYIRRLAKHTLAEKEEEIISKKDINLMSTVHELRSQIETDQIYEFSHPRTNKRVRHHNSAILLRNVYSMDEKVRENTYKALFKPYINNINKYFAIYQAVVKDWNQEMVWRGYKTPIQIRNESNDISDLSVDKLIKSLDDNVEIFRKYFRYKAKCYGVKKISRYDIYSPLNSEDNTDYSFEESKDLVLEILKDFDSEFYKNATSIFEHKHIDTDPLKGKSSGAFCATLSPKLKPYILLNYANRKRDTLILAHELGHGIHSIFAEENFPSTQEAPLILAETASTLCEMMAFEYLYKTEKNIEVKKQMLSDKITDSYATICRQIYFTKFEIYAHETLPNGVHLDEFNKAYLDNLTELFGDSVKVDEVFKYEWAYIPHIVNSPFYCYAYAFGNLLSLSLYGKLKESPEFINSIKSILRAGGSSNPEELLYDNKIFINDEDFWQYGFNQINAWIDELIALG